jgi:hypothetical protein
VGGDGIEEVDFIHLDLELEPVSRFALVHIGVAAADEGVLAGLEVEIGFCSHGFDDVHHGLEGVFRRSLAGGHHVAVLGPDAEDDFLADVGRGSLAVAEFELDHASLHFFENNGAVLARDCALDEVHGRAPEEAGDEKIHGFAVDLERGVHLLDEAVFHHDDARAHGHGLDLVVSDVDHGGLEALVELGDLGAHLDAHFGVEVGEGFVEEEDLRLAHDGAAHGHTLALAAGKGLGFAFEILFDAENGRSFHHTLVDFGFGVFAQLQAEGHVVVNRHVGIERVVLEDHRDVTILGWNVVHAFVADEDVTLGDFLQPGDHAQGGGLAAAGGADEDDKFAVFDFEVEVGDGGDVLSFVAGVDFVDVFKGDFCHGGFS